MERIVVLKIYEENGLVSMHIPYQKDMLQGTYYIVNFSKECKVRIANMSCIEFRPKDSVIYLLGVTKKKNYLTTTISTVQRNPAMWIKFFNNIETVNGEDIHPSFYSKF